MGKPKKRTDVESIQPGISNAELGEYTLASLKSYCKLHQLPLSPEKSTGDYIKTTILEYLDLSTNKENTLPSTPSGSKRGVLKKHMNGTVSAGPTPKKSVQFSVESAPVHYYSPEKRQAAADLTNKFLESLSANKPGSKFETITFDDLDEKKSNPEPVFSIFSPRFNRGDVVDSKDLSLAELSAELKSRGLSTVGTRKQKLDRLEAHLVEAGLEIQE